MQNFRNPWWPLITTTIPVAILYYIFREAVGLVADQLSATQITSWKFVGTACACLFLLHTSYALWHQWRNRTLDRHYALITIGTYALFLFLCCGGSSERIPEDVQGSVLGENRLFYAAACLSPAFIHGVMILVLCPPQKPARISHLKYIASDGLVAVLMLMLICNGSHVFMRYIAEAGFVLTVVALHYFVVRWILQVLRRKPLWRRGMGYIFKVSAAVAYPLSGILVNNDILFDIVFRTFAYPGFYAFALTNGIVLCLPEPRQRHWRVFLFMLRVITFGFLLFMLILYLPLLPQSAMALASFGLGYLMLAPILLTIVKTKMILTDVSFLKFHFSVNTVILLSLCAVLICLVLSASVFQTESATRAFAAAVHRYLVLAFRS